MPRTTSQWSRWTITDFKDLDWDAKAFPEQIRFACWQKEKCPETGREHFQAYIELSKKTTLTGVKKILPTAHLEPSGGTARDNVVYCSKSETRIGEPNQWGVPMHPGERNDLLAVQAAIDEGTSERQIAEGYFVPWVRYNRSFERYRQLKAARRRFKTFVTLIVGPPGTGKSEKAWALAGSDAYVKPVGQWWDYYDGTTNVIIDDFRGWIQYTEFLHLLDKYPCMVQGKGTMVNFAPKNIVITSTSRPEAWYEYDGVKRHLREVMRRIDRIVVTKRRLALPDLGSPPARRPALRARALVRLDLAQLG